MKITARKVLAAITTMAFATGIAIAISSVSALNNEAPTAEIVTVDTKGIEKVSEEDVELLAKVMYSEAGSEWITDEEQMMFGTVVLNRVKSPEFPNTIKEVVYQENQYDLVFENCVPDARTIGNARQLLNGYDIGMPESVVFQANFMQGNEIYQAIEFEYLGTTYFCHSPNMEFYNN